LSLMPEYRSFTARYEGLIKNLLTPVNITPVYPKSRAPDITPVKATGLWDTGATRTCIKTWVSKRLNLQLFATQARLSGIGGDVSPPTAFVNIRLMCDIEIDNCPVYVVDLPGYADILIGMDIISKGNFAICNINNKTSFSFIVPPYPEHVDFTTKTNYKLKEPP